MEDLKQILNCKQAFLDELYQSYEELHNNRKEYTKYEFDELEKYYSRKINNLEVETSCLWAKLESTLTINDYQAKVNSARRYINHILHTYVSPIKYLTKKEANSNPEPVYKSLDELEKDEDEYNLVLLNYFSEGLISYEEYQFFIGQLRLVMEYDSNIIEKLNARALKKELD